MHFTSFRPVAIHDIYNHVAEGIEVLTSCHGPTVPLIQLSGGLLFLDRISPPPPEEPNRLSESFFVVDQFGGHSSYAVNKPSFNVSHSLSLKL